MEKLTLRAYAVKHKQSIFHVMKMVKSGTLQSETVMQEGKEVLYIILDEHTEENVTQGIVSLDKKTRSSLENDVKTLQAEVRLLKKEIETLKNKL